MNPNLHDKLLWTALTAFWNGRQRNDDDMNSSQHDDEVLCLTALCQLATSVVQDEEYCTTSAWQDVVVGNTTSYGNILVLAQLLLSRETISQISTRAANCEYVHVGTVSHGIANDG